MSRNFDLNYFCVAETHSDARPRSGVDSRDHIVEGVVVNIPDYSLTKPVAPVLPEGSDLVEKKIIIFTVFAQFHRHMKSFFDSCGMKTRVINGGLSTVARTKAINNFKTSDEHILIFSNVGSTGLNLTFARTILLPRFLLNNMAVTHDRSHGSTAPVTQPSRGIPTPGPVETLVSQPRNGFVFSATLRPDSARGGTHICNHFLTKVEFPSLTTFLLVSDIGLNHNFLIAVIAS
ncbi:hypothetical protein B0H14DRAFT_2592101 [Mycena olivaceomarginata]|nr:hypothetical protein B0H14DRAFT_2592101 [Mycena olivaceomarginata]